MKKRQEIQNQIKKNLAVIKDLQEVNLELLHQSYLLCDDEQWFVEKVEKRVRPNSKGKMELIEFLVGRIHWVDDFIDVDTGDKIPVERSRIVKVNGLWMQE